MASELEADQQWWYIPASGAVERGMQSPSSERIGPFATEAEAQNALAKLAENARKWAEEDEAEA